MYLLLLTLYNRLQIKPRITCLCYFDLPTFWRLEEKTAWKAGNKKKKIYKGRVNWKLYFKFYFKNYTENQCTVINPSYSHQQNPTQKS